MNGHLGIGLDAARVHRGPGGKLDNTTPDGRIHGEYVVPSPHASAVDHDLFGLVDFDGDGLRAHDPCLVVVRYRGREDTRGPNPIRQRDRVAASGAVDDHGVAIRGAAAQDPNPGERASRDGRVVQVHHVVPGVRVNDQGGLVVELNRLEVVDRDLAADCTTDHGRPAIGA